MGSVCVTSILRTVAVSQTSTGLDQSCKYLANLASIKLEERLLTDTNIGDFIPRSVWTLVECNMGIICVCLPMMRRPLSFVFPWLFRGSTRKDSERLSYVPLELRYKKRHLRPQESQSQEEIWQSDVQRGGGLAEEQEIQISVTTEIQQSVVTFGDRSLKTHNL